MQTFLLITSAPISLVSHYFGSRLVNWFLEFSLICTWLTSGFIPVPIIIISASHVNVMHRASSLPPLYPLMDLRRSLLVFDYSKCLLGYPPPPIPTLWFGRCALVVNDAWIMQFITFRSPMSTPAQKLSSVCAQQTISCRFLFRGLGLRNLRKIFKGSGW